MTPDSRDRITMLAALTRGSMALALGLSAASCSYEPVPPPADHPAATVSLTVPASPPAAAPTTIKPNAKPHNAISAPTPIAVIGLSETDVEAIFGPPASRTREGAGHTWRYVSGNCSVTLFFFLDLDRNKAYASDQTLSHADYYALDQKVTGTNDSEAAAQNCLRRIADAKTH